MLSSPGATQGSFEQGLEQPVPVGHALSTSLSCVTSNLDGFVGWGVRDESSRLWCGRESSGVEVRNRCTVSERSGL